MVGAANLLEDAVYTTIASEQWPEYDLEVLGSELFDDALLG